MIHQHEYKISTGENFISTINFPTFSIIILFWNNLQFISRCLQSLSNQTNVDFEIIIIENGSSIPLNQEIFRDFPNLKIEFFKLPLNIGFSAGNNLGVEHANGRYIITLNADAFPEKNWLENIHKAIQKYPDCFFASKLVMADDPSRLDGVGDIYHFTGLGWRKFYNYNLEQLHLKEEEVFSACAAAAIYPKKAFTDVGGFDPDYFSYGEDVDLGFRLRLAGYKCIFLPNAIVQHVGSASTGKRSDFSVYYGHRNLVWTFVKNMPGVLFWVLLPSHLLMNLFFIWVSILRKQGKITIKAKIDAIKYVPICWEKRKIIQVNCRITKIQIIKLINWNPISPFYKLFHD